MTFPLQQASTQRMRLKFLSNPTEGDCGKQPITSGYCQDQSANDSFPRDVSLMIAILDSG